MAMVYLSNRNISSIPKVPEQYTFLNNELKNELEELNMLLEKKEKENKVPFNTQAKGHDVSYKYNPIPGPGAYNLDIPKKIIENENSPFLYKSQRFKKINKELIIPGPGSYNIYNNINNNKISLRRNKSQLRPNSNISLHNEINSKNNVATIPAKKQEFGYNIDKNGELTLAVDPIADYCFNGTKNDSIGPGRYDPVIKEKNHCIRWDKSTGRKSDIFFGANTEIKNENTNSSLIDTDISSLKSAKERNDVKKIKQKPFKFIRYKNIRNNSEINNNINMEEDENIDLQKEFEFLNHKNNIISGPKKSRNYLLKYNNMRYPSKPAEFQFFGSSNRRNLDEVLILNNNTKVGPGSYFHNTFKKFQNLYFNKNKYSFENSKEEKKRKLHRSLSNVGPGSYNIDRSFEKKSFNIFGSFSTEKRFGLSYDPQTKKENDEGGNPGPGSYNINNDTWVKDMNKIIKKPILVNVDEEIKKPNNTKKVEKIENQPDFNLYQNNRYINIIQENIKRKANPYTSENNPFLSGNNRFKINGTDFYENIGPGKYDLFKKGQKTKRFYSILAPFNTLEEKKPIYIGKGNNNVAPGQHSKDSYFDWNKKSFNALFMN